MSASARRPRAGLLNGRGQVLAVIAVGGALGSLARWGLGEALAHDRGTFATSTLVANASGALALGVLMVLVLEVWPPTRLVRPFLGVGVLGGYTTFSTYMLDTEEMLRAGHAGVAAAYLFTTLALGLLASWSGVATTRAVAEAARRRRLHALAARDTGRSDTRPSTDVRGRP
jgi:CrcB protein